MMDGGVGDVGNSMLAQKVKVDSGQDDAKKKRREKLAAWKSMMKIHPTSFSNLVNTGSNQKSEVEVSKTYNKAVLSDVSSNSVADEESDTKLRETCKAKVMYFDQKSHQRRSISNDDVGQKIVKDNVTLGNTKINFSLNRPITSRQRPRGIVFGDSARSLHALDHNEKEQLRVLLAGDDSGAVESGCCADEPRLSAVVGVGGLQDDVLGVDSKSISDIKPMDGMRENIFEAVKPVVSLTGSKDDLNSVEQVSVKLDSSGDDVEDPFESYMSLVDAEVTSLNRESADKIHKTGNISSSSAAAGDFSDMSEDENYDEEDDIQKLVKTRALKVLEPVDHSQIEYPAFRKCFYVEVPDLASMSSAEVSKMREQLDGIRIRGKNCPKPLRSFSQSSLPLKLLELLKKNQFDKPTPIQAQSLPAIMSGRDVIGIAKTGSGKTLAFVLPMIRHILDQPPLQAGDGPIALVMAPTRELVTQIQSDVDAMGWTLGVISCAVYGGAGIGAQISELKRGAHCVIATPGRIIELLCTNGGRVTNLRRVTYLALDEADRMFDMGFEQQIFKIVQNIRPDRQTVMFSATFPRQVESGARKILSANPLEITVHGRSVVPETIEQIVEVRATETKFRRLLEYIARWITLGSILIFAERQESVDALFQNILMSGYQCMSFHSGKEQMDREEAIEAFKNGLVKMLVATSAAARGLDVQNLRLVVNYDVPNHHEDYVHRVGRTGRAGQHGTAVTFLDPESEDKYAGDLIKALQEAHQLIPEELQRVYQQFDEKHKAGLVKKRYWGFSGHGYKFTEEEERQHKAANMGLKRHFGADYVEDISDGEENSEEELKNIHVGTLSSRLVTHKDVRDAQQNEEDERKRAIDEKLREIEASKLQDNSVTKTTHYDTEIEINEFPKNVRWKVLRKDAFVDIVEFTGCAIAAKGVYVMPGKAPPSGERKLHLSIEGPTQEAVAMARAEIKRKLEDAMNEYLSKGGDKLTMGRYSVLE